jgi:hypothetical protein
MRFILALRRIPQTLLVTNYKGFKPAVQIIRNFDLTRYILLNALSESLSLAKPCLEFCYFSLALSNDIECLLISECDGHYTTA